MIRNILLKTTVLTLTLGFLSNPGLATNRHHDDELSDPKILKTAAQVTSQNPEETQKIVFSGKCLLDIGLYLGRLEVGRMQQVSKNIKRFFTEGNESLKLWESYAHQLQLDVADVTKVETLVSCIKDYYKPQVHSLLVPQHPRFKNIMFTCFSFSKSILAGYANDSQNDYRVTAVKWENGEIKSLGYLYNGIMSKATGISVDGRNIVGSAVDKRNNGRMTAVKWRDEQIKSLGYLNNGSFSEALAISADGRDIVGAAADGQNKGRRTAVKWRDEQIEFLGYLPNGTTSGATNISADGQVIVGSAVDSGNGCRTTAVKWENEEIKSLGQLNNGNVSEAFAVSADGQVIVGSARDGQNRNIETLRDIKTIVNLNKGTIVKWENGEIKPLDQLSNRNTSKSVLSSADGRIIVGLAGDSQNDKLTIVKLEEVLFLDDFFLKKFQDHSYRLIALSSNGSSFITQSEDDKFYYKNHLPRYDLWKMK